MSIQIHKSEFHTLNMVIAKHTRAVDKQGFKSPIVIDQATIITALWETQEIDFTLIKLLHIEDGESLFIPDDVYKSFRDDLKKLMYREIGTNKIRSQSSSDPEKDYENRTNYREFLENWIHGKYKITYRGYLLIIR